MSRLFEIRETELSVAECVAAVAHAGAGGIDVFIGAVRDTNQGRAVTVLEYEAYASMAEKEMRRIGDEIEAEVPGCALRRSIASAGSSSETSPSSVQPARRTGPRRFKRAAS